MYLLSAAGSAFATKDTLQISDDFKCWPLYSCKFVPWRHHIVNLSERMRPKSLVQILVSDAYASTFEITAINGRPNGSEAVTMFFF